MMEISSSLNKRKGEAQKDGESVAIKKRQNVTMDMEVLHCTVCFQILRPPVFQCGLGHLVCSPCRDNLPGGKCPSPSCSGTPFVRCVGMERVVNSVEAACSYAKHGWPEKISYVDITEHENTCPHAPCLESGCGFAAACTAALAEQFTALHTQLAIAQAQVLRTVRSPRRAGQ